MHHIQHPFKDTFHVFDYRASKNSLEGRCANYFKSKQMLHINNKKHLNETRMKQTRNKITINTWLDLKIAELKYTSVVDNKEINTSYICLHVFMYIYDEMSNHILYFPNSAWEQRLQHFLGTYYYIRRSALVMVASDS